MREEVRLEIKLQVKVKDINIGYQKQKRETWNRNVHSHIPSNFWLYNLGMFISLSGTQFSYL